MMGRQGDVVVFFEGGWPEENLSDMGQITEKRGL